MQWLNTTAHGLGTLNTSQPESNAVQLKCLNTVTNYNLPYVHYTNYFVLWNAR
jgi:hypothetical protein